MRQLFITILIFNDFYSLNPSLHHHWDFLHTPICYFNKALNHSFCCYICFF
nr:MAG TPA: hypothetical protein [Caudoviricetes sp.]